MSALIGKTLGPYEIIGALGAGGMGEVYRAKDTRLGREVAIKVLPENLAKDPAFKERFGREARTISQLAHAHICTLYDVGHQDGIDYLVMELLEGETLADRLAKSPLPPDQLLKLGVQIADALEFAHRSGVIHRDMKPGNIMLTKSGAKLMDFGLAKESIAKSAMGASAMTAMVTSAKPLTTEGTLVGTFQYMAPEQLEGKEADARTDIFALGVVLYEMATAKRAFTGKTQASVIASILASEPPPISTLQPMTPPALERVIRGCMAKDPDDRIQTAHDLKMQLQWIVEAGSQANIPKPVVERRKLHAKLGWLVAAMVAVAMFAAGYYLRPAAEMPAIMTSVNLPAKVVLGGDGDLVISPDGKYLAFIGSAEGQTKLWVRPMDSDSPRVVEGTEEAFYPFWSGDSKWIAFFANGRLKKVAVTGGPVQTIADAPDGRGGTWSKDGVILFAPRPYSAIYKVSAAGGTPVAVTQEKPPISHRWPSFLADGKHFLYFEGKQADPENSIFLGSIDRPVTTQDTRVLKVDSAARYAEPGYLLYVANETLMAQPFDGKHPPSAEAVPITERVQYSPFRWMGNYSASSNGLLVFRSFASSKNQLTWFDRDGRELGKLGEPAPVQEVSVSPDGSKVLAIERDAEDHTGSVYLYDTKNGSRQKVSFEPGAPRDILWSKDGKQFVYSMISEGKITVYLKATAGTEGARTILIAAADTRVSDLTKDNHLIYNAISPKTQKSEIYSKAIDNDQPPVTLLAAPDQNFIDAVLSENGKWLLYENDLTHSFQLYVVPFPPKGNQGARWQISNGGSQGGAFASHDSEVIFVAADGRLVSVPINASGATLGVGAARTTLGAHTIDEFDGGSITTDGKRFLVSAHPTSSGVPVTVVSNWTNLIKK